MSSKQGDLLVALVVVVLLVAAYSAFVSSKVAMALNQVDREIQGGKKTLEGWRKLIGI